MYSFRWLALVHHTPGGGGTIAVPFAAAFCTAAFAAFAALSTTAGSGGGDNAWEAGSAKTWTLAGIAGGVAEGSESAIWPGTG